MLTIKPTDIDPDTIFLSGWKSPEHDFIWALGPVNIMNIPLGPTSEYRGRNLRISIELDVPTTDINPEGSRLTFMLGGTVLLDQVVKARTRIIFYAPASTTTPRLSIIHITNHNPASINGMTLGFQFYEIQIEVMPTLRESEVVTFGQGSSHSGILGSGWKDPEEGFCWSLGKESTLTFFFDAEACSQQEWDGVRVAEIILSVIFHDRVQSENHHWHILDVMSNKLLLHRQIHQGVIGPVPIHAYVPVGPDASGELRLIDHCAISPAMLGNDPNDQTVLGFQLITLELLRIYTFPCAATPGIVSLLDADSRLAMTA